MSNKRDLTDDVGIIALVTDTWSDSPWMSRHQILTRLGSHFPVLWCDPAPGWRNLVNPRDRLWPEITNHQHTLPTFSVYKSEIWLPNAARISSLSRLSLRIRLKRAKHILTEKHGCRKFILYLWHPRFAPALNLLEHDVSCYHIVDEYSYSDTEVGFDEAELGLISKVDQVFISSRGLARKKGSVNPNTEVVPNGVDFAAYARPAEEPHDLRSIPHPRIGYSGIMKASLDWVLLKNLAYRHPEWQFVFVGPTNRRHNGILDTIQELASRPNVHFLGPKTLGELATYPQHFDVCLLPYRVDSHMLTYGYPLKLHEYLASGSPVVGMPLLTLLGFDDVIRLACTPDEWSQAISDSLTPSASEQMQVDSRRQVARQHDWDQIAQKIADALRDRLFECK